MSSVNQRDRAIESKADRRIRELERQMQQVPSRWVQSEPARIARIIGGNLQNGVQTIKYVPDVSFVATAVYNAAVDVVYDDGLGNGDVYTFGSTIPTRMLVRHNYGGFPESLMGGNDYLVQGFSRILFGGTAMVVALIGRG